MAYKGKRNEISGEFVLLFQLLLGNQSRVVRQNSYRPYSNLYSDLCFDDNSRSKESRFAGICHMFLYGKCNRICCCLKQLLLY